ncbi:MAG: class I SAM-dependent methyltransferase [Bulleidia sp.]
MNYQEINASVINRWVKNGWEWGKPISHEDYLEAVHGTLKIHLTTAKYVPRNWFPENLKGKKVLGLASGGGQQMPVLAAAGAECTVLDYSEEQLNSEKLVAKREGYSIRIIRGDMTKPLPFVDEEFDLIVHPVSNCYVKEVKPIFRECYRILKHGGIFLGGYDLGINYVFDDEEKEMINKLPFDPLEHPDQMKQLEETDSGIQFSHTLEEQIGGQLEAGFVLTGLFEDYNLEGRLKEFHVPAFVATRAVKQ